MDWLWYHVWLIFNPSDSIQIIIGLITLGIAFFTYKSAKSANNSTELSKELFMLELKPLVVISGWGQYSEHLFNGTHFGEDLKIKNYGEGCCISWKT